MTAYEFELRTLGNISKVKIEKLPPNTTYDVYATLHPGDFRIKYESMTAEKINEALKELLIDQFALLMSRAEYSKSWSRGLHLELEFTKIMGKVKRAFDGEIIERTFYPAAVDDIPRMHDDVSSIVEEDKMYNIQAELRVDLYNPTTHSFQQRVLYLKVPYRVHRGNIDDFIQYLHARINNNISAIEDLEGSGFRVERIADLKLSLQRVTLAGCWREILIPKWLSNKKAILNVKSSDNRCFAYAIIAALKYEEFKHKGGQTRQNYKTYARFIPDYNWEGIEFPTPISTDTYKRFEKQNDVSLNVYQINERDLDDSNLIMIYQSGASNYHTPVANILLIGTDNDAHFVPITQTSRLVNSAANHRRGEQCSTCLRRMPKEKLQEHRLYCGTGKIEASFPKKICKFESYNKKVPCPFVIYADIESMIGKEGVHTPISISYLKVHRNGRAVQMRNGIKTFTGADCITKFLYEMADAAKTYASEYKLMFTQERGEGKCDICGGEIMVTYKTRVEPRRYCYMCRPTPPHFNIFS